MCGRAVSTINVRECVPSPRGVWEVRSSSGINVVDIVAVGGDVVVTGLGVAMFVVVVVGSNSR